MNIVCSCVYNCPPGAKGVMRDFRALWALEESGRPYDREWIDLAAGEMRGDRFLSQNPLGQIPCITIDGEALFESGAIAVELADRAGGLIAAAGSLERRRQVKWVFAATATLDPQLFNLFLTTYFFADEPGNEIRRDRHLDKCRRLLGGLESEIGGREFLVGGQFSVADLLMTAVLCLAEAGDLIAEFPTVRDYAMRHRDRPAHARAYEIHTRGPRELAA